MKKTVLAVIPVSVILLFFHDSVWWVVTYWFSDARNLYYFGVACVALVLFWNGLRHREIKLSIRSMNALFYLLILVFIIAELINVATIQISGLSAVLLWGAMSTYLLGITTKETRHRVLIPLGLLFFSLPIIYYLNTTFGRLIRVVFAQLIGGLAGILAPQTRVSGTLIITDSAVVSIDSGCSGIQTLHVLAVLSLVLSYIKSFDFRRILLLFAIASVTYLAVNFVHLLAVVYLHNVRGILDVHTGHVWLGVIVSVVSVVVLLVAWSLIKSAEDEER